jgi:hypothetical protein
LKTAVLLKRPRIAGGRGGRMARQTILKRMSWTPTDIVTKKWIFEQTEKKRKKEKGNENEKI